MMIGKEKAKKETGYLLIFSLIKAKVHSNPALKKPRPMRRRVENAQQKFILFSLRGVMNETNSISQVYEYCCGSNNNVTKAPAMQD